MASSVFGAVSRAFGKAGGVLSGPRTRRWFNKLMRRDAAHTNRQPLSLRTAARDVATISKLPRPSVPNRYIAADTEPTVRRHDLSGPDF